MSTSVVTGLIALISAGLLALLNAAISTRAGVDGTLRSERLKVYPPLWSKTQVVSRWPHGEVTRAALELLHSDLRTWYYCNGGMYMSEGSRARYGQVQELIEAMCQHATGTPQDVLVDAAYNDLMETCSAMRTALTQDLDTRRRKSVLVVLQRSRWHAVANKKAVKRIADAAQRSRTFRGHC
jgi:hypothetical protein